MANVHLGLRSKGSKPEDMVAALLGPGVAFLGFGQELTLVTNEVECYRPLILFRQILTLNWTLSISNRNGEGPDPLKT